MSLKAKITIFLILVASINVTAYGSELRKQVNFLLNQRDYIKFAQKINLNHINNYLTCLENKTQRFTFEYITKDGEIASKNPGCKKLMPVIFNNRLENKLQKMRLYLALSNPKRREEENIMLSSGELYYKLNPEITHPNTTAFTRVSFEIKKPYSLSKKEIRSAERLFDKSIRKMCRNYQKSFLLFDIKSESLEKYLSPENLNVLIDNFCNKTSLDALSTRTKRLTRGLFNKYYSWLAQEVVELRKFYKDEYYKIINESPYFLLIKSSTPSDNELINALTVIKDNALKVIKDDEEYEQEKNIEERIKLYRKNILNEEEINSLFEDLTYYLNDPFFSTLEKLLKKDPDYAAKKRVESYLRNKEFKDLLVEVSLIAGGVGLCFTKLTSVFKMLKLTSPVYKAKIFKLGCFTALGIPVNTWFIYDSLASYETSLINFLTSVDGRQIFKYYESISRSELIINTLFMGVGIGSAKTLIKTIKSNNLMPY